MTSWSILFRLFTSRPLPLIVSKGFSSAALAAATPAAIKSGHAAVKSGHSQYSYILTQRMFRLLTSRPLPSLSERSSLSQHRRRRPLSPSRAASLTIIKFSPTECFVSLYLVPSPSLSCRASLLHHRRWRPLRPSRAASLIYITFKPTECFVY